MFADSAKPPQSLADLTCPELLVPRLAARNSAEAIRELAGLMAGEGVVPDLELFVQAVLRREASASTVMEAGIAFPHGRIQGEGRIAFAFGRAKPAIPWGRALTQVGMVFLMSIPSKDSSQYLRLISGLARLSKLPEAMARLGTAQTSGDLREALALGPLASPSR